MKLFIGGLAWATDSDGLREAFSEFGKVVDAKVILDRETGRSRGFGFVTFASKEDGQRAINEMNDQKLDGRNIRVNQAEDKGGGRGPGGGGGDRRGPGPSPVVETRRRSPAAPGDGGNRSQEGEWESTSRGPKNRKSGNQPPENEFVDRRHRD